MIVRLSIQTYKTVVSDYLSRLIFETVEHILMGVSQTVNR